MGGHAYGQRRAAGPCGLALDGSECAYWVLPGARGQGVAPRALTTMSNWALKEGGFHRLELAHSDRNEASCMVQRRPVLHSRAFDAVHFGMRTAGMTCICMPGFKEMPSHYPVRARLCRRAMPRTAWWTPSALEPAVAKDLPGLHPGKDVLHSGTDLLV